MNTQLDSQPRPPTAFTLIELLVVIAIIGVLAGLMLPVGARIKQTAQRNKARAELEQIAFAIETYKEKLGHYPPDAPNSPNRPRINPLFFELLGTKLVGGTMKRWMAAAGFRLTMWPPPSAASTGSSIAPAPLMPTTPNRATLPAPTQTNPVWRYYARLGYLRIDLLHPLAGQPRFQPIPAQKGLNPWRYVVTNPTNNPGAFDLWVDILVGGKTNRISNWSPQPQIVNNVY